MALNLTKAEVRAACTKLRMHLGEGLDHDDIAVIIGLDTGEFQELLKKFYEVESDELRGRTTEQTFIDYTIKQTQNIKDLTNIIEGDEEGVKSNQVGAIVGAIRARADIHDKIIAKGQEFGFIEKKAEKKIVAGLIVAQMSTPDLRKAIAQELGALDRLMSDFVDAPSIIDIDPGPMHLPTPKAKALPLPAPKPAPRPAPSSVKKHARNPVHGGRKVTKT